jgi:ABC-type amino acid transport substrate-binding protein
MNAVTRTLGLVPDYRETAFESIIPSVQGGKFNVGMSSFTDNKDRESMVDVVTYFHAGTLSAQRTGSSVDPTAACGLRVGGDVRRHPGHRRDTGQERSVCRRGRGAH